VLAQAMLARAFDAGVPFSWVTADEAYGQVKYLRVWLEQHDVSYVLATRCNDEVITTSAHTVPNPTLWPLRSDGQVHLTAFERKIPSGGPAVTFSALIADPRPLPRQPWRTSLPLWADGCSVRQRSRDHGA
jgi:hypothetical protein